VAHRPETDRKQKDSYLGEMGQSVKDNGVPAEYVLFPDEGHGFRKKENEIEGYGKIKVFLDEYLK